MVTRRHEDCSGCQGRRSSFGFTKLPGKAESLDGARDACALRRSLSINQSQPRGATLVSRIRLRIFPYHIVPGKIALLSLVQIRLVSLIPCWDWLWACHYPSKSCRELYGLYPRSSSEGPEPFPHPPLLHFHRENEPHLAPHSHIVPLHPRCFHGDILISLPPPTNSIQTKTGPLLLFTYNTQCLPLTPSPTRQ